MPIKITCDINISSELFKLLKDVGVKTGTLTVDWETGKGYIEVERQDIDGSVSMSIEGQVEDSEPKEQKEEPEVKTDMSVVAESSVSNIFAGNKPSEEKSKPVIRKIAAIDPPEDGEEPEAIKPVEAQAVPEPFEVTQNESYQEYVSSVNQLMELAFKAQNKPKLDIDLSQATSERERAVLQEKLEKYNGIDMPAYVVNEKVGALTVNDLNVTIMKDSPFNLANLSAEKISGSKDLMALFKEGYLKFVNPQQAEKVASSEPKVKGADIGSLEVFDDYRSALKSMGVDEIEVGAQDAHGSGEMEITDADMEATEEETMMLNLTQSLKDM